jgi:hypothetical protein
MTPSDRHLVCERLGASIKNLVSEYAAQKRDVSSFVEEVLKLRCCISRQTLKFTGTTEVGSTLIGWICSLSHSLSLIMRVACEQMLRLLQIKTADSVLNDNTRGSRVGGTGVVTNDDSRWSETVRLG